MTTTPNIVPPDFLSDVPAWLRSWAALGADVAGALKAVADAGRITWEEAASCRVNIGLDGPAFVSAIADALDVTLAERDALAVVAGGRRAGDVLNTFDGLTLAEHVQARNGGPLDRFLASATDQAGAPVADLPPVAIEQLTRDQLGALADPLHVFPRCEASTVVDVEGTDGEPNGAVAQCVKGTPHAAPHLVFDLDGDPITWGEPCAIEHVGFVCELTARHVGLHAAFVTSKRPTYWAIDMDPNPSPVAGSTFGIPADTPVLPAVPLYVEGVACGAGDMFGHVCVELAGHSGEHWAPTRGGASRTSWDSTPAEAEPAAAEPPHWGWGAARWTGPPVPAMLTDQVADYETGLPIEADLLDVARFGPVPFADADALIDHLNDGGMS